MSVTNFRKRFFAISLTLIIVLMVTNYHMAQDTSQNFDLNEQEKDYSLEIGHLSDYQNQKLLEKPNPVMIIELFRHGARTPTKNHFQTN